MALLSRSKNNAPSKGKVGSSAKGKAGAPVKGKAGAAKPPRGARLKQIRAAWTMTRQADPKVLPLCLAAFFGPLALALAVGLALGPLWLWLLLGFMIGLITTTFVFGRRVQQTAFAGVEGQVGAAAAVLNAARGDWRVTPAVAFNREQELVHRVLGRPGVILVAEPGITGVHKSTRNLLATEKKRLVRVIGDTPVYDLLVGDDEGQVPLRGLEKHLTKLPRNLKPKQVNELDRRLKPLGAANLPIPKGPMPTTGRVPRGKTR